MPTEPNMLIIKKLEIAMRLIEASTEKTFEATTDRYQCAYERISTLVSNEIQSSIPAAPNDPARL